MLLKELDAFFRGILDIEKLEKVDPSLNGVQIGRLNPEVKKVAFAVDASLETAERAVREAADVLVVHHGLFWGVPLRVEGVHYGRIKFFIDHDLALYAVHLPLDLHPELGNNAGIARTLGLTDIRPFGAYKGVMVGVKGIFTEPKTLEEVKLLLSGNGGERYGVLPFGPESVRTVGIVSGSGTREAEQAMAEGLDLYITGESSHEIYHSCLEAGMNVIAAGHYRTEVWGVRLLSERLSSETGLATFFIDAPTGL